MYKKLILLSSLFILMSIVPAWAQYSFEKRIGMFGDEQPSGMEQASDGYFYLYGKASSYSPVGNGQNYIAKIDHLGNVIWQRTFTDKSYADEISDMIELPDGSLFFGGVTQGQLQDGNARITIVKPDGTIVLDTLHAVPSTSFGCIQFMVNNSEKGFVASIGVGAPDNRHDGLMFQKTDYSGKRLWYKYLPYPDELFRLKKMFKRKDKDEYIIFGQNKVLWLDSVGNMLDSVRWAIDLSDSVLHRINDIVQNENGTFTCLVERSGAHAGSYLQLSDEVGRFLSYRTKIPSNSGAVLTKTKDKGYFVAGGYFVLIDSNEQIVWEKRSTQPEATSDVSIGQSTDGCFYGCAIDNSKNSSTDIDMYIFKTTVDGVIKSGINDIYKQTLKARVMPNPSAGLFTITGEFKQAQARITNLLGQQVLHSQGILQGDKLDASALENGIYILSITERDNTYVQKINIIK